MNQGQVDKRFVGLPNNPMKVHREALYSLMYGAEAVI